MLRRIATVTPFTLYVTFACTLSERAPAPAAQPVTDTRTAAELPAARSAPGPRSRAKPGPRPAETHRNIPYLSSGNPRQNLDIYAPAGAQSLPVIIWVHGGGWELGDKANVRSKPEFFTKAGFVFVSINYRLAPETNPTGMAEDVAQAIAWVHRQIDRYGGSNDNLHLLGHSAGAHLAALVATDASYLASVGLDISSIRSAVLLDGAGYDIPRRLQAAGPRAQRRLTRVFGTSHRALVRLSPITHIAPGKDICPMLVVYAQGREVSRDQAESFVDRLEQAGGRAQVLPVAGNHAAINQEFGGSGDQVARAALRFYRSLAE